MKVATIQMVSGVSVPENLNRSLELLTKAADAGAELAVLPEYFCLLGHRDTDKLAVQELPGAGPIQQFLADAARSLGLWIVGGTLPISCPPQVPGPDSGQAGAQIGAVVAPQQRVFNSSLVFSPAGNCVQRYDKIHCFVLTMDLRGTTSPGCSIGDSLRPLSSCPRATGSSGRLA